MFGTQRRHQIHLLQLAEAEAVAKAVTDNNTAEQAALAAQDLMAAAQVAQMVTQVQAKASAEAEVAKDGTAGSRITVAETLLGRHYIIIQLALEAAAAAIHPFKEALAVVAATMAAAAVAAAGQVEAQVVGHIPDLEAEADLIIVDQIKATVML